MVWNSLDTVDPDIETESENCHEVEIAVNRICAFSPSSWPEVVRLFTATLNCPASKISISPPGLQEANGRLENPVRESLIALSLALWIVLGVAAARGSGGTSPMQLLAPTGIQAVIIPPVGTSIELFR